MKIVVHNSEDTIKKQANVFHDCRFTEHKNIILELCRQNDEEG